MAPQLEVKTTVVIGIDFGTTYSGVAWAKSTRPDRIDTISNWNSIFYSNTDKEKAPTTISYSRDDKDPSWGYNIPPTDVSLKWFKLLLIDHKDQPEWLRRSNQLTATKSLLVNAGKVPVEAIADYLKLLWDHSIENIERVIGKKTVTSSTFRVIVTLPAIWPHYAQMRMREAAELAGILATRRAGPTSLSFISEPEAAALATIDDMKDHADIGEDDHFVICDAGGGTVDIITYTITGSDPMVVKESVKGDGKLCGAVYLDEGFLNMLRSKMPPKIWDKLGCVGIKRLINDEWEHGIKEQFFDDKETWEIQVPYGGTASDRYHPPSVKFTKEQMLAIFESVTCHIEELVKNQISTVREQYHKFPKYMILAGGFGRSRYLHECLQKAVGKRIEVLQGSGPRPWTAVCRGAVMQGLTHSNDASANVAVSKRISRAHYGTLFNALPFNAAEHNSADRVWCDIHQEFLAVEQTRWFVNLDVNSADEAIEIEIVVSDSAEPPYRKDASVKSLCVIRISNIKNMYDKLPEWQNKDGQKYRRVQYELRMRGDGASLDFAIYHKKRRLESHNVSVEFSNEEPAQAMK